ncbi:hypothetical protein B0T11DRAFT_107496 [Plectosphaerella cucumerina]|uniref:Secreted protein n=1 Tax=Plectosphaerella cucumerina TaxID=40658 RepID=A0A8K0TD46_9PEZI|nr:hypothetical protein B0T11DRAFT_107496 [Plectosphaerella cucumerina]
MYYRRNQSDLLLSLLFSGLLLLLVPRCRSSSVVSCRRLAGQMDGNTPGASLLHTHIESVCRFTLGRVRSANEHPIPSGLSPTFPPRCLLYRLPQHSNRNSTFSSSSPPPTSTTRLAQA